MLTSSILPVIFSAMLSLPAVDGYEVGDKADNFQLKNVDGEMIGLSDFPDAKGFIVIFTCNHCPYAQAYQDRIIGLDEAYKDKGYPVIAINPVSARDEPRDSYENMIIRAEEKGYTFPYLHDANQDVLKKFGAEYTPTAFILQKSGNVFTVMYIGAIDDNYQNPSSVKVRYVENALNALLDGASPDPNFTKAIGCGIPYSNVAFAAR